MCKKVHNALYTKMYKISKIKYLVSVYKNMNLYKHSEHLPIHNRINKIIISTE